MICQEIWRHWHIAGVAAHKMIDPSKSETSSHTMAHGHAVVSTVAEKKLWDIRQGVEGYHEKQKAHLINS
jgi:hypothetical protein